VSELISTNQPGGSDCFTDADLENATKLPDILFFKNEAVKNQYAKNALNVRRNHTPGVLSYCCMSSINDFRETFDIAERYSF
jgi:hypothetical protein